MFPQSFCVFLVPEQENEKRLTTYFYPITVKARLPLSSFFLSWCNEAGKGGSTRQSFLSKCKMSQSFLAISSCLCRVLTDAASESGGIRLTWNTTHSRRAFQLLCCPTVSFLRPFFQSVVYANQLPQPKQKKKLISRNEFSTRSYFLAWIFNFAPKLFRLDKDNSIKSCHPQLRDDDDHERGSKLFPKEMNRFWPHAHPHRRRPLPFSR